MFFELCLDSAELQRVGLNSLDKLSRKRFWQQVVSLVGHHASIGCGRRVNEVLAELADLVGYEVDGRVYSIREMLTLATEAK